MGRIDFGSNATGAIENIESDGLLSTYDSLAYRVAEIERHLHSYERWLFKLLVPAGGKVATLNPVTTVAERFQMDAGNNAYGAWVQLLDVNDTPVMAGSNAYYDLHRIEITDVERTTIYKAQISFGATGDAGIAAGNYTEFTFISATIAASGGPVEVQTRRQAVGTPAWARCWNANAGGGTMDFVIGLHEYEG